MYVYVGWHVRAGWHVRVCMSSRATQSPPPYKQSSAEHQGLVVSWKLVNRCVNPHDRLDGPETPPLKTQN